MSPRHWPGSATEDLFRVYGFLFRFRTNHPDARVSILSLYERFPGANTDQADVEAALVEDTTGGFRWWLGETAGTTSDLPSALWSLEAALCQAIIESQRRCIAVHACTIYAGNLVTLLVGRSGAGKTTLSLALVRRGLTVASDDVALVEPETLNVLPIPRCFHLDSQSVALLEADGLQFPPSWKRLSFMVPGELGVPATGTCRVHGLIFMSGPRAEQPRIAAISQAEMAAHLLSETAQGPIEDLQIVRGLCRLAGGASCYSLVPGPLAATADALACLILRQQR